MEKMNTEYISIDEGEVLVEDKNTELIENDKRKNQTLN